MSTKEQIANMALRAIGVGKTISDLDTDTSAEAVACRTFWETIRDEVLSDFPWPFATKFATLGLVEEDPTDEYQYSYRYPSDCLKLRRILSGARHDSRQTRVHYRVGQDTQGKLIYTDEQDAQVEYTLRETNTERFPSDLVLALSYKLAAAIAPSNAKGDPFKLVEKMLSLYEMQIGKAKANAANEDQPDENPESQFIRERE